MNLESFHALHPKQYLAKFIDEGVRPDGRLFTASRRAVVTTGTITTADGSALVRLGKTSVVSGALLGFCARVSACVLYYVV